MGTAVLNAAAAIDVVAEASGVNAAAAAGDDIGSGHIGRGLAHAAVLIGGAKLAGALLSKVSETGAAMGTRYMGESEAAEVARTGTIPNVDGAGRPRAIHYTADAPTTSASTAEGTYQLRTTPTHMCQFPLCNVQNSVAPEGAVAPGATQAATSLPINGAGRPIPLDP